MVASRPKLTQRRRLQALEAAVEVIAEKGLSETRVADVAARAGLSPALLLYYFRSKNELLTDALTFAEDRFYLATFHELTELDDPRLRLVRLIDLSCPTDAEGADVRGDWALWLELWARALRHPEATRKREALDRRWRNTIAEIVRAGQDEGHFDRACDADDFSIRLAALMDGLALQVVLEDPAVSPARMRRPCVEAATRQLGFAVPEGGALVASGKGRSSSRR
jgi:AcrR family transcriptional regulator